MKSNVFIRNKRLYKFGQLFGLRVLPAISVGKLTGVIIVARPEVIEDVRLAYASQILDNTSWGDNNAAVPLETVKFAGSSLEVAGVWIGRKDHPVENADFVRREYRRLVSEIDPHIKSTEFTKTFYVHR